MNDARSSVESMGRPGFLRRWRWCGPMMLVAAALLVRGANRYTVFDDEAFSCRRYVLPMGKMVSALYHGAEPDPPLYYVIENTWISLTGRVGPIWLRCPSIVFFLIGLVALRRAAAAWFDDRAGQWALVLAAVHPAHVLLGFAARWYSLMFLAVALLLWATARLARRPGAVAVAAWVLAATMAIYTNYFGPVVVGWAWMVGMMVGWRGGVRCRVSGVGGKALRLQPSAFSRNEDEIKRKEAVSGGDVTAPFGRRACPASSTSGASEYDGSAPTAGVARPARTILVAWIAAALLTLVLYLPWIKPFVHQLTAFPRVGGSASAYLAQTARVGLALTSGNLASLRVWWVHGPMALAVLGLLVLMIRDWRRVWPVAMLTIGCYVAGVASLSMLDKYVMTFSGPACVLLAALLVRARASEEVVTTEPAGRGDRSVLGDSATRGPALAPGARIVRSESLRWFVVVMLFMAWAGCHANLIRERHWSSLRWLDPFETAVAQAVAAQRSERDVVVATHPSAGYYLAARDPDLASLATRLLPDESVAESTGSAETGRYLSPRGALAALGRFATEGRYRSARLVVLECAEFADDADWLELRRSLSADFALVGETNYLEDPDAAWKDRLDPQFRHPRWRIVVRVWERRPTATAPVGNP